MSIVLLKNADYNDDDPIFLCVKQTKRAGKYSGWSFDENEKPE